MKDAGRIGFLIRGNYEEGATYDFLDIVYYAGNSYVAKKETTGNPPVENSEYWQIFAAGDQGAKETAVNSLKWSGFSVEILSEEAYQQLVESATADPFTFYGRPKTADELNQLMQLENMMKGADE